jgi:hypothetical protein
VTFWGSSKAMKTRTRCGRARGGRGCGRWARALPAVERRVGRSGFGCPVASGHGCTRHFSAKSDEWRASEGAQD